MKRWQFVLAIMLLNGCSDQSTQQTDLVYANNFILASYGFFLPHDKVKTLSFELSSEPVDQSQTKAFYIFDQSGQTIWGMTTEGNHFSSILIKQRSGWIEMRYNQTVSRFHKIVYITDYQGRIIERRAGTGMAEVEARPVVQTQYSYDEQNRLKQEIWRKLIVTDKYNYQQIASQQYQYWPNGQLYQLTSYDAHAPTESVTFVYDEYNKLVKIERTESVYSKNTTRFDSAMIASSFDDNGNWGEFQLVYSAIETSKNSPLPQEVTNTVSSGRYELSYW